MDASIHSSSCPGPLRRPELFPLPNGVRRYEGLRKAARSVVLGYLVWGKARRGDMAIASVFQPSQGCRIQNHTLRKNVSRNAHFMRQDAAERFPQRDFAELQKQILSTRVLAATSSARYCGKGRH